MLRELKRPSCLLALLGLAAGCTTGNSGIQPGFTSVDLNKDKVQLAVGVATFNDGSQGLNTVATLRQPDGTSVLLSTPTLTGPAAFVVPAGSGGIDGGTNHISGSPQILPGQTAVASTFGQSGGVFTYGFAPANSTTGGGPNFNLYTQAFYGDPLVAGSFDDGNGGAPVPFRGGPPAYPNTRDGTFGTFRGYTEGFVTFATAAVAGAYNLSVNIPSGNSAAVTLTAPPANLTNTAGLPALALPTFTPDGTGGGTVSCPPPAGVTEEFVNLYDSTANLYYTVMATGGTAVFSGKLGPIVSGAATATIATGDLYEVTCIGVDYPAFEAGPPLNRTQTPVIIGSNGQADITFSPRLGPVTY